jgi:Family of unknown function (DUF6314)
VCADQSWPPPAEGGGAAFGPAVARLAGGTARFLLGEWNVVREVRDHRSGKTGAFRGTALLAPEPGDDAGIALSYRELGELTFGGHHGPASRSLSYRERPDGAAEVRFADGRPFYQLDLRAGHCRAEHLCGADRYLVSVRVLSHDSFTEMWRVTGPAKDYEMTTTYVRTGSQQ